MRQRGRWLTTGAAAQIFSETTGHHYGPGVVRYYNTTRRLPASRTTTGVRLFKESDVRRLAAELAERRLAR